MSVKSILHFSVLTAVLALGACGDAKTPEVPAAIEPEPTVSLAKDGWDYAMPAEELRALCEQTVATAKEQFAAIEGDTSPATLESVYGAYETMGTNLEQIQHAWYMKSVHPDESVR
ncbi:MAG: hypothetical protein ACPF9H_10840, partial [Aequoribacter sp.]